MTSNCLINASEPFCVRMMENKSAQCVFAFCRPESCDVTKVKYKQKTASSDSAPYQHHHHH